MSDITAIRVRVQDGLCVLQVKTETRVDRSYYGDSAKLQAEWRDAAPEDLLVVAKFTSDWSALRNRVDSFDAELTELRQQLYQREAA